MSEGRARRLAAFEVKVGPSRDPEYGGELRIEYTTNGFQWYVLDLLPESAAKLAEAIRVYQSNAASNGESK